jgi:hypothetical protein
LRIHRLMTIITLLLYHAMVSLHMAHLCYPLHGGFSSLVQWTG